MNIFFFRKNVWGISETKLKGQEEYSYHPNTLLLQLLNEVLNSLSNYNPEGRFGSKGTFLATKGHFGSKGTFLAAREERTIINISIIYSICGAQISGMWDGSLSPIIYAKRRAQNFFWHGVGISPSGPY